MPNINSTNWWNHSIFLKVKRGTLTSHLETWAEDTLGGAWGEDWAFIVASVGIVVKPYSEVNAYFRKEEDLTAFVLWWTISS